MGNLARELEGAGRRVGGVLVALAALGCGPGSGPQLTEVRRVPLAAPGATTLHVDAAGRVRLGDAEGLRVVDSDGEARRIPLEVGAAPRVLGTPGGRLRLQAGERLLSLDVASGTILAERDGVRGVALPDARGRFLLVASPSGEVLGLDPLSLEALWIWPSLGDVFAAALSPEGDRAYLVVAGDDARATLVSRDLQTGRAVHAEELSARLHALVAGPGGSLLAAGEGVVVALEPREGALRPLWRRSLRSLGLGREVELRSAPGAGHLAVFSPGSETGLRVLDAETGKVLGSARGPVLDAAFTADGALLYLLSGAEVRVVAAPTAPR